MTKQWQKQPATTGSCKTSLLLFTLYLREFLNWRPTPWYSGPSRLSDHILAVTDSIFKKIWNLYFWLHCFYLLLGYHNNDIYWPNSKVIILQCKTIVGFCHHFENYQQYHVPSSSNLSCKYFESQKGSNKK